MRVILFEEADGLHSVPAAIWRKRTDGKRSNSSQAHEKTRRNKRRYPLIPPARRDGDCPKITSTRGHCPKRVKIGGDVGRNTPKSLRTPSFMDRSLLRTASVTVSLSTGLSPFFVAGMGLPVHVPFALFSAIHHHFDRVTDRLFLRHKSMPLYCI